jgi:hypothetical protein
MTKKSVFTAISGTPTTRKIKPYKTRRSEAANLVSCDKIMFKLVKVFVVVGSARR